MPATTLELFEAALSIVKSKKNKEVELDLWLADDAVQTSCVIKDGVQTNVCGTIACGAGWVAQDGQFNRLGLFLERDDDGVDIVFDNGKDERQMSFNAIAAAFGISEDAAELAFSARWSSSLDSHIFEKADEKGKDLTDKQLLVKRLKKIIKELKKDSDVLSKFDWHLQSF